MKIVMLFTGGRSGSDFLQSLLDEHKDVAQFPGILHFTNDLLKIFKFKDAQKIAKKFISLNQLFFDSRRNKKERHDKLGKKKNEFYVVNKKLFEKSFINIFNKTKKNNLDILLCLHKAYMFSKGYQKKKFKIVFLHIHLFENFENYLKVLNVYKNSKIIITYRDPLVSMCSTVKNWSVYRKGIYMTPRHLFTNYLFHFNIFNDLKKYKHITRVVKLENIHTKSKITLKRLSNFIGIKYSDTLLHSTYFGKKWWGDSISKKYLDGLNSNFNNKFDRNIFTNDELEFIENRIMNILIKYKYPIRSTPLSRVGKYYFPILKLEKIFYRRTLNNSKLKTKLSIIYFYIKRLILFKEQFTKRNLPNEI
jgi:hypothetical protein